MPVTKSKPAKGAQRASRTQAAPARLTLKEVMATLEKSGSEQTRKTYARHGATEAMFGVSFAVLGGLQKKIGVDHALALELFGTRNLDALNLAYKIADPARLSLAELERWALSTTWRTYGMAVAMLAAEGPHGRAAATRWMASKNAQLRSTGWTLVAQLALRDPTLPDAWFAEHLAKIVPTLHAAPDSERYSMNSAVIAIGGRSPALRKAALAAAKKIGKVEVDHGDTSCKTPDAGPYIEKLWAYATSKGFATPSLQEQARESPRTRC